MIDDNDYISGEHQQSQLSAKKNVSLKYRNIDYIINDKTKIRNNNHRNENYSSQ